MKNVVKSILTAKDSKVRIAKSLIFGTMLAFLVGFSTSEKTYYEVSTNDPRPGRNTRTKNKTEFNELFIILGLIMGSGIGYLLIKEEEPIK